MIKTENAIFIPIVTDKLLQSIILNHSVTVQNQNQQTHAVKICDVIGSSLGQRHHPNINAKIPVLCMISINPHTAQNVKNARLNPLTSNIAKFLYVIITPQKIRPGLCTWHILPYSNPVALHSSTGMALFPGLQPYWAGPAHT